MGFMSPLNRFLIVAGVLGSVGLVLWRLQVPLENPLPTKEMKVSCVPQSSVVAAPLSSGTSSAEPHFISDSFLQTSLAALAENGSDLSKPMRSRHQVRCESADVADHLREWAASRDFETKEPTVFLGHGGVEFFDVELVRKGVPEIAQIQEEGRLIHEKIRDVAGARYATWVGEIVR